MARKLGTRNQEQQTMKTIIIGTFGAIGAYLMAQAIADLWQQYTAALTAALR